MVEEPAITEDGGSDPGDEHNHKHNNHHDLYHWVYVFGATVLLGIFDFAFFYPENHLLAFLSLAAWFNLISIFELSTRGVRLYWVVAAAVGIFGVALFGYWIVGPILREEHEEQGSLRPGNDPIPTSPMIPKDAVGMLAGGNTLVTDSGRITVKIATCEPFSIKRNADGLSVNASLFDDAQHLVASIVDNKFSAITGNNLRLERKGDLSNLAVYDGAGVELLFIRYMNPTTIKIRGQFHCPNRPMIIN